MVNLAVYSDLFGFINAKITINPAINVIAVAIKKRGMLGYLINKYKTQSMEAIIDAIASAF